MDNEAWRTQYHEPYLDLPHHPTSVTLYPDIHAGFFDDKRYLRVPVTTRSS